MHLSLPRYTGPSVLSLLPLLAGPGRAQEPRVQLVQAALPIDDIEVRGGERWLALRVVDGITGAPLPGAEVLLVDESAHPMRGEFWSRERTTADADGIVRIHGPEGRDFGWILVRAGGYAARMAMGSLDGAVVALTPSFDMPVQIRDWQDRPVPGALVGFCAGCGHTPDLAWGTTGADGVAVLRGVDPHAGIHDLYVEHEALALGYDDFPWFPGLGPIVFRVRPGVPSTGVLVDDQGRPVAGAYVGSPGVHRGPWTRTGPDGSFRLFGCEDADDLFVRHQDREVIFGRPPAQPFRLVLPPPAAGEKTQLVDQPKEPETEADTERAVFTLRDAKGGELPRGWITAIGPLPARGRSHGIVDDKPEKLWLVPGRYEVRSRTPDHRETMTHIEVVAGRANEFDLRPEPLPASIVRVSGLPADGSVGIRTGPALRDITKQVREGRSIGLPEESFVYELRDGGHRVRIVPGAAAQPGGGPVELAWWPPTRVRGQLVDEEGEPVAAKVVLVAVASWIEGFDVYDVPVLGARTVVEWADAVDSEGAFDLASEHRGLAFLVVRPDRVSALLPRIVPVVLPERGERVSVELGTLRLAAAPALRIVDAAAAPLAGVKALWLRAGYIDLQEPRTAFVLDAEGGWLGPDLQAGDAILLPTRTLEVAADADHDVVDVAWRSVLAGTGPWQLQVPNGELRVDVRGPDGKPVPSTVILGAAAVEVGRSTLLRRLAPGPLRVLVAAAGHQGAVADVVIPASGAADLHVVLPPR